MADGNGNRGRKTRREINAENRRKFVSRFVERVMSSEQEHHNLWRTVCLPDNLLRDPQNAVSGIPYRGINRIFTQMSLHSSGYEDPRFLTKKQAERIVWDEKVKLCHAARRWAEAMLDGVGNEDLNIPEFDGKSNPQRYVQGLIDTLSKIEDIDLSSLNGMLERMKSLSPQIRKGSTGTPILMPVYQRDTSGAVEVEASAKADKVLEAAIKTNQKQAGREDNRQEEKSVDGDAQEARRVKKSTGKLIGTRLGWIFHVSAFEGLPSAYQPLDDNERVIGVSFSEAQDRALLEKLIERVEGLGLNVERGGSSAFYKVGTKDIQIPQLDRFEDLPSAVRTILHEAAHATEGIGAERRFIEVLDKVADARGWDSKYKQKVKYALEEVVAEITANQLATSELNIHAQQENHLTYVKAYLNSLSSGAPGNRHVENPLDFNGEIGEDEVNLLYAVMRDAAVAANMLIDEDFSREIRVFRQSQAEKAIESTYEKENDAQRPQKEDTQVLELSSLSLTM